MTEQGTLVVVYWYDAIQVENWTPIQLIATIKPPLAKSVGWLLNQDDKCVRLLTSVVGEEAGYQVIPSGMVEKIEIIRDDEIEVPEYCPEK